jgi:hypothetical protein
MEEKPSSSLHHDVDHLPSHATGIPDEKTVTKPKRHDLNWTSEEVDFSMVDEKATLRKMDIRLIPILAILYLLSFLDRGNIGNAKIQGLTTDLKLEGNQYNICLTGVLTSLP